MRLLPEAVRARLRSIRLLEPLLHRDYALLTAGAVVSLLGDGFFNVALLDTSSYGLKAAQSSCGPLKLNVPAV